MGKSFADYARCHQQVFFVSKHNYSCTIFLSISTGGEVVWCSPSLWTVFKFLEHTCVLITREFKAINQVLGRSKVLRELLMVLLICLLSDTHLLNSNSLMKCTLNDFKNYITSKLQFDVASFAATWFGCALFLSTICQFQVLDRTAYLFNIEFECFT